MILLDILAVPGSHLQDDETKSGSAYLCVWQDRVDRCKGDIIHVSHLQWVWCISY